MTRLDLVEEPARVLQRRADRISFLIVATDYPDIDIEIEIRNLRRWCAEHMPDRLLQRRPEEVQQFDKLREDQHFLTFLHDRLELFEMVYASRFSRLWRQFRDSE